MICNHFHRVGVGRECEALLVEQVADGGGVSLGECAHRFAFLDECVLS